MAVDVAGSNAAAHTENGLEGSAGPQVGEQLVIADGPL